MRQVLRVLLTTPEGRAIVDSEVPPDGFAPLTLNSTDNDIDARVRCVGNTFYHPGGSAAMGKVVDTD